MATTDFTPELHKEAAQRFVVLGALFHLLGDLELHLLESGSNPALLNDIAQLAGRLLDDGLTASVVVQDVIEILEAGEEHCKMHNEYPAWLGRLDQLQCCVNRAMREQNQVAKKD